MTSKLVKTGVLALSLLALGSAVTATSSFVFDQPAFAQSAGGGGQGGGGGGGGPGGGGGDGGGSNPAYAVHNAVPGGPGRYPPTYPPRSIPTVIVEPDSGCSELMRAPGGRYRCAYVR